MTLVDVLVLAADSGVLYADLALHRLARHVEHDFRIILLVVFKTTVSSLDKLHRLGLVITLVLRQSMK